MKARLFTKWGTYRAGDVVENVQPGDIPAHAAEFFEDSEKVEATSEPVPEDVPAKTARKTAKSAKSARKSKS